MQGFQFLPPMGFGPSVETLRTVSASCIISLENGYKSRIVCIMTVSSGLTLDRCDVSDVRCVKSQQSLHILCYYLHISYLLRLASNESTHADGQLIKLAVRASRWTSVVSSRPGTVSQSVRCCHSVGGLPSDQSQSSQRAPGGATSDVRSTVSR